MAQIVISTNLSLDGVVQDPDGGEGSPRGGWFAAHGGGDLERWSDLVARESYASTALLLGRRTDAWFASRWLSRDTEWARHLNAMPKHVVSSSAEPAAWSNATVVPFDAVAALKDRLDGDVLVYASYALSRALLDAGLVDELRLFVFPVVVGAGLRLFQDVASPAGLTLRDTRRVGDGLLHVRYDVRPVA